MNGALFITTVLFLLSGVLAIGTLVGCRSIRNTLRSRWGLILLLLLVNLILKLPWGEPPYHGLEYEDCFVHQAVARQLRYDINFLPIELAYREAVFSVGSIDNGVGYQTFYNTIGYPAAIRLLQCALGDGPLSGHLVSLFSSTMSVVLVVLLASRISWNSALPLIAGGAFTCMPIANSCAMTTSAEVFSSFYVALALLLAYVLVQEQRPGWGGAIPYIALIVTLMFSILIKRENLLLLLLLPLVFYFAAEVNLDSRWRRVTSSLRMSAIIAAPTLLFVGLVAGVFSIYRAEETAIQANAFSIHYLTLLGAIYLKALSQPNHYLIFGMSLVFLPIAMWRLRKIRPVSLVVLGYILMYASHWPGYYLLKGSDASIWDATRHLANIAPLLAIVSAGCLLSLLPAREFQFGSAWLTRAAVGITILLTVIAGVLTFQLRSELTCDEQLTRIEPVMTTVKLLYDRHGEDFCIFTFEPCVFQIHAPRWTQMIDLATLDCAEEKSLEPIIESGRAYAMVKSFDLTEVNYARFRAQAEWLSSHWGNEVCRTDNWFLVHLTAHQRGRMPE